MIPSAAGAAVISGEEGVGEYVFGIGVRQNSHAIHELSHVLLRHETRRLERIAGLVFLTCDADQEEQADALGATLLLPRPLLVAAHAGGMSATAIAKSYGVSEQLARWRLHATVVAIQIRRRSTAG